MLIDTRPRFEEEGEKKRSGKLQKARLEVVTGSFSDTIHAEGNFLIHSHLPQLQLR
jgi:hypothetical protein